MNRDNDKSIEMQGLPGHKFEQSRMVMLDSFIELILAIVQLLADSTLGESPEGGVPADLMFIRN